MPSTFPNYANISNPLLSVLITLSFKKKSDGAVRGVGKPGDVQLND